MDSTFNRNEYQKYFLGGKGGWCVGLTTLPPSCAVCLEVLAPQPSGILKACPGLFRSGFALMGIWKFRNALPLEKLPGTSIICPSLITKFT
jgi:hypothetical protein